MNRYLHLTSGRGPEECGWAVARLLGVLTDAARQAGLACREIDLTPGHPDTLRSAVVELAGDGAEAFVRGWEGTVRWIGRSPFRPHHRRRNWFVGVYRVALDHAGPEDDQDVLVTTFRASGPGGQHVNKTASAVRAIHRPTGLTAVAQEERSQSQNRRLALARLRWKLRVHRELAARVTQRHRWDQHQQLERGNAVRTFVGPEFRPADFPQPPVSS